MENASGLRLPRYTVVGVAALGLLTGLVLRFALRDPATADRVFLDRKSVV